MGFTTAEQKIKKDQKVAHHNSESNSGESTSRAKETQFMTVILLQMIYLNTHPVLVFFEQSVQYFYTCLISTFVENGTLAR